MLKNIFNGSTEDSRIIALRKVLAENAADETYRDKFSTQHQESLRLYHDALDAFGKNPCAETEKATQEAFDAASRESLWNDMHRVSSKTITERIITRTQAALIPAMEAVCEKLEADITKLQKEGKASAEKLGLSVDEVVGPQVDRITDSINGKKNQIATLKSSRIDQAPTWAKRLIESL